MDPVEGSKMTFIVRLTRDEVGSISGVVEQVKTGLKARVEGLDAVDRAIAEMIAAPGADKVRDPPEGGGRGVRLNGE